MTKMQGRYSIVRSMNNVTMETLKTEMAVDPYVKKRSVEMDV